MATNSFEDQKRAEQLLGLFDSLSKKDKVRIIGELVARNTSKEGDNEMEITL